MPIPVEQFKRSVTVSIGEGPLATKVTTEGTDPGLRIAFKVDRDTKPFPNNVELGIWNLSKSRRNSLLKPALTCQIEAGYLGATQVIFLGTLRRPTVSYEGTEIVFKASGGDGEGETNGTKGSGPATINVTFAKGSPVVTVLQALIEASGVKPGNVAEISDVKLPYGNVLTRPLTLAGPVVEELSGLCRALGVSWSVQSGAFQFLRIDAPYTLVQGPLISPETGLLGAPRTDVEKNGKTIVTGSALLLPEMVPGKRFVLKSESVSGLYAARKTSHIGDTHGNDWRVEFEGVAL